MLALLNELPCFVEGRLRHVSSTHDQHNTFPLPLVRGLQKRGDGGCGCACRANHNQPLSPLLRDKLSYVSLQFRGKLSYASLQPTTCIAHGAALGSSTQSEEDMYQFHQDSAGVDILPLDVREAKGQFPARNCINGHV
jgi:hypothetical protein